MFYKDLKTRLDLIIYEIIVKYKKTRIMELSSQVLAQFRYVNRNYMVMSTVEPSLPFLLWHNV